MAASLLAMLFRFGVNGAKALVGCGVFLSLFGLVLLTPVGIWLVKALGWVSFLSGLGFVGMGIYLWLTAARRRYF